jgi:hypothetical protein
VGVGDVLKRDYVEGFFYEFGWDFGVFEQGVV